MSNEVLLSVSNLVKKFGDTLVLDWYLWKSKKAKFVRYWDLVGAEKAHFCVASMVWRVLMVGALLLMEK